MIVRWPGVAKAGRKCETPVNGVDFYPTFLDIAGAQRPAGHILDGESILPVIKSDDGKLKREAIFWHFPCYLPGRGGFRITPSSVIRQGDWKLTEHFEDGRLELYNLREDLGETNDLAAKKPEKARELKQRLDEWHKQVGAKIPTQPNPKYDPNA